MGNVRFKSTLFAVIGAVLTWIQAKGYIDGDTATLIASILAAIAAGINLSSSGKDKNPLAKSKEGENMGG